MIMTITGGFGGWLLPPSVYNKHQTLLLGSNYPEMLQPGLHPGSRLELIVLSMAPGWIWEHLAARRLEGRERGEGKGKRFRDQVIGRNKE